MCPFHSLDERKTKQGSTNNSGQGEMEMKMEISGARPSIHGMINVRGSDNCTLCINQHDQKRVKRNESKYVSKMKDI